MARHDPHGKEDLGERFSQFASVCGITDGHDLRSANDTPALNALKALRGAPISMGRGEIPVELLWDFPQAKQPFVPLFNRKKQSFERDL